VTQGSARVVAIGGGHGLAATLAGLVRWCDDITAVVSVADDGGSSGRLRRDLGIPAPGDMRRCLSALTPNGLARDALEYRFDGGDLDGHAAGNVWLAALLESASDPVAALDTLVSMVGARGRILPATLESVDLVAHTSQGEIIGQVAVSSGAPIKRISTVPADPLIPIEVTTAIERADAIVIGPGSFFTSVLAALVPGVVRAIAGSGARVIYVANLGSEDDEAPGFTMSDHVDSLRRHGLCPQTVLADSELRPRDGVGTSVFGADTDVVFRRIAQHNSILHDPDALGLALFELVSPVRSRSPRTTIPQTGEIQS